MSQQITSWSFSRWSCYQECPKKAYFKFIAKIKEPSSPALERGTALHALAEAYLKKEKRVVPKELKLIGDDLKDMRARGALAEADFTFTKDWQLTRWNDWNNAWLRVKADVTIEPIIDSECPTVFIDDFKSGKVKEGASEYMLQLELYSLSGLLKYPTAVKAKTRLLFIDHGVVIPHEDEFTQKDVKALKKAWETRTKKMLSDTKFKPTPGNACRWCYFRQDNAENGGGQCQF